MREKVKNSLIYNIFGKENDMKRYIKIVAILMAFSVAVSSTYAGTTVSANEIITQETTKEITTEIPTEEPTELPTEPPTEPPKVVYEAKNGVLTKYYDDENRTTFTIPNTITAIGDNAFKDAVHLKTIKFQETSKVTTIGKSAFSGCIELSSCSIPASVTTIKDKAFENCPKLKKITLRKKVTIIGKDAFAGDTALTLYVYANSTGKAYAIANNINWVFTDSEIARQNKSNAIYAKYMSKLSPNAVNQFKLLYLDNYVPQGVCVVGNYLIVSMYYKGLKKNSILLLYNKKTGAFIKKVVLPSRDHVGSIVNIKGKLVIGLCNISITDYVAVISPGKLKKIKNGKKIKYDYKKKIPGYADFAQYDGSIYWAGHSANISNARMYGYTVKVKKKKLVFKKKYSFIVPSNTQGLVVQKSGNYRTFTFTSSYGRTNDSKLLTYKVNIKKNKSLGKAVSINALPPMAEGMYMTSKKNVYMLFESGAGLFCGDPNNTSEIQINNVCRMNLAGLLQM